MIMQLIAISSSILLAITRIMICNFSPNNMNLNNLHVWRNSKLRILKISDEILFFSIFLFTVYILSRLFQNMDKNLILVSSIITSLIFFIIPLISNVLLIGNLVYPVNGIGIVKSDSISVYLLGIYSRMHLSELALGILTMLLSFLSKNIFVLYIGIIVGIVQIAQTYYSKSTSLLFICCNLVGLANNFSNGIKFIQAYIRLVFLCKIAILSRGKVFK